MPREAGHAQATYAPLLKKEDGAHRLEPAGAEIHNRVRGLQPWPGAYTAFAARRCTSGEARVADAGAAGTPGAVRERAAAGGACGEGALELLEVQTGRPQAHVRGAISPTASV